MAANATQFATWILRRIVTRVRVKGTQDAVFRGNYCAITYARPVKAENEDSDTYLDRVRRWRSRLPRQTNTAQAVAFAREALLRDQADCVKASARLLEAVRDVSPQLRPPMTRGIPWIVVRLPFGHSKRGRRGKRKRTGYTSEDRINETLRAEAARYKREHSEFQKLFESQWAIFKSEVQPPDLDAQLLARLERVRLCERDLGVDSLFTISAILALADTYYRLGKYWEAIPLLQRCLAFWQDQGGQWPHLQQSAIKPINERLNLIQTDPLPVIVVVLLGISLLLLLGAGLARRRPLCSAYSSTVISENSSARSGCPMRSRNSTAWAFFRWACSRVTCFGTGQA